MSEYIKNAVQIINISYIFPFGIKIEILKVPKGFLSIPQYWWLLGFQIDSSTSYLTIVIFGFVIDWKKKRHL